MLLFGSSHLRIAVFSLEQVVSFFRTSLVRLSTQQPVPEPTRQGSPLTGSSQASRKVQQPYAVALSLAACWRDDTAHDGPDCRRRRTPSPAPSSPHGPRPPAVQLLSQVAGLVMSFVPCGHATRTESPGCVLPSATRRAR